MSKKYIIDNIEFNADVVMEGFKTIFHYIGSHVLKYDDQELADEIYEDYDFHYTDLADFRLDILLDSGHITDDIRLKAQEMRSLSEKMFAESVERSANIVRNSAEWQRIISLADQISGAFK